MTKKLNNKQQMFVNEYLVCFNAAEAARRAGYSNATARQQGARLLTNVDISEEIALRIKHRAMSADEALARLSDQARSTMADFVQIKDGIPYIDLANAEKAAQLHILKKFKVTDKGVEIELYDAQSALIQILREQHLKSDEPTERVAFEHAPITNDERVERLAALADAARTRRMGLPQRADD